jgi:predicted negative regulator of RcsB-dependent stress response
MGDAYLSTKNYEYAKASYLKAWQTDPDNQMVRSRMQFLNSIFR